MKLSVPWFHIFYYRKPVYVIGAELCTWKFADFQNSLQKQGVARPFTGMENVSGQLSLNALFFFVSLNWYQFFNSECSNHRMNKSMALLLLLMLLLVICVLKIQITESWYYSPLNDTAEAATQVIAALAQRGWTIRAQWFPNPPKISLELLEFIEYVLLNKKHRLVQFPLANS